MAKDKFYFDHDYNARNDDKILELRSKFEAASYGVFWMIVETMCENENGGINASLIGGLSLGYGVAKEWLIAMFQFCVEIDLFYEKDGYYFSERILEHKEFRKSLSDAGRTGAEKRWGSYSPPNAPPNAKERKGNKIKDINIKKENKEKEYPEFKKNPKHYPLADQFKNLPDIKNKAAAELMRIQFQTTATKKDIDDLWEVFKIQKLTGENFYESDDKVYSHFIDWVKTKKINNGTKNIDNQKSKLGNKSGGFGILTDAINEDG